MFKISDSVDAGVLTSAFTHASILFEQFSKLQFGERVSNCIDFPKQAKYGYLVLADSTNL